MIGRIVVVAFTVLVVAGVGATLYVLNRPTGRAAPVVNDMKPEPPKTTPGYLVPKPSDKSRSGLVSSEKESRSGFPGDSKPELGTLIIESDVPETSVFIDRVYLGNAPVTARNLTPGPHRLNMSVTGYEGVAETIDVTPGTRTISMKFKEIKLDEKLDVTHKHAMGSCSGVLRATPQRLAYETTNTNDAFTAALTNLEAFDVDYVQKNLRVKVRDGKTYNFTEFSGNADRLYLFHQTVEKVRQRLLAGRRP